MSLGEGELFLSGKIIVWRQIKGYCVSLIVEKEENIMLASNFLSFFLEKIENLSDLEHNIVIVSEFLNEFLPNGELMFISVSFSQHLQKNLKKFNLINK